MPGTESLPWVIWGAIMVGLGLQLVGTLMGPARQSTRSTWLLSVGAALMLVSALAGVVISVREDELGAVVRYASVMAILLVLLLVMWRRNARATPLAPSGEPDHIL